MGFRLVGSIDCCSPETPSLRVRFSEILYFEMALLQLGCEALGRGSRGSLEGRRLDPLTPGGGVGSPTGGSGTRAIEAGAIPAHGLSPTVAPVCAFAGKWNPKAGRSSTHVAFRTQVRTAPTPR